MAQNGAGSPSSRKDVTFLSVKAGGDGPSPDVPPGLGRQPSGGSGLYLGAGTPKRARIHGDHDDPMAFYPVPRFPVGHTSAAFESMAVRKSLILTPPEIYAECAHHGEEKAKYGYLKLMLLSVIAGCYVAFGFSLCLLIGGNIGVDLYHDRPGLFNLVFGAIGFPTGFTFIVICGGELFTSLCAYMAAAWWEGRVSVWDCVRIWVLSWFGNLAGTGLFVGLMVASGSFAGKDAMTLLMAAKKVHNGFGPCFVLGVLCNWLVCIATWQANAAQDMTGKFIAIWLPISAFVMMGFQHVIANQYLLPLAVALGAPLSAYDVIVGNLIPTTLGNWVGGAVCVATVYAFTYGTPNKRVSDWFDSLHFGGRRAAHKKAAAAAAGMV
ncbi:MAG: Formate/nitrite transporter-domain-containing protein [Monoraphidium minutum]|nr:MAG: Formate/nitrite transporter-domain-containing protein [Monoraphidium minutum]